MDVFDGVKAARRRPDGGYPERLGYAKGLLDLLVNPPEYTTTFSDDDLRIWWLRVAATAQRFLAHEGGHGDG